MAISDCYYSPTSENPHGFSVCCELAKLSPKPRSFPYTRPLAAEIFEEITNVDLTKLIE